MQLKRKIVKFVKFVTAFDPGHKWKKLTRIEANSICHQDTNLSYVCQHEFSNFSLPCEGRLS